MGLFGFLKKKKTDEKSNADISAKATADAVAAKEEKNLETENKTVSTMKKNTEKAAPASTTETKKASKSEPAKNASKAPTATSESSSTTLKKKEKTPTEAVGVKKDVTTVTPEENTDQASAYTGRFEINKSKDGKKYFFNLYASNKVGIATSQMYSSAQSALNGIKSVIANAPTAPVEDQSLKNYEELPYPKWEIYVDNGGKFRFRLNASNGNCVCHSQGYTTKNACKNGIDSIIRSSKNAEIDKTYISKKDEK